LLTTLLASSRGQVENGGPLIVELVEYEPKRGNVLITYPGKTDRTISFVGRCAARVHRLAACDGVKRRLQQSRAAWC
jgi:hypothetical protein